RWRSGATRRSRATRAATDSRAGSSDWTDCATCRTRRSSSTGSGRSPASAPTRSERSASPLAAAWCGTRRPRACRSRRSSRWSRGLGGPRRLYMGALDHDPSPNPPKELAVLAGQVRLWFDRYLKGIPNGVEKTAPILLAADPWTDRVATYRRLPPTQQLTIRFAGRTTIAQGGKVARVVRLPRLRETFGDSVVSFTASSTTGWDHVVAVVSYGDTVVSVGGAPVALGASPRTVHVHLLDQAVRIPRGARLTLTIAATSTA